MTEGTTRRTHDAAPRTCMAELQLVVVQARALAAEDQGHRPLPREFDRAQRGLARVELLQLDPAAARGAAQHQRAVGDRFGQRGMSAISFS